MPVKIPDSGYLVALHGGEYLYAFPRGRGPLGDTDALKKARRAARELADDTRMSVDIVAVGARGEDRYVVDEIIPHAWSRSHATKRISGRRVEGNKAWYVFYIPKGRMPKSFGGKSGWDWPKAYFGPYESRAAASSAVQREMRAFDEPSARYKIRNVTPQEFAKLWGTPPGADFAPPWSSRLRGSKSRWIDQDTEDGP